MKAVLIGDDMTLSCIPAKMRTAELCHQAVLRSGFAIDHVPHKLRTQSLLTLAVDKYPQSIRHLDPSQRNRDVCWTAVNGDGLAIRFVPSELLTPELRMIALDQPDKGAAIRFLPEPTQEEILTALRNTNYKLGLISKGSLGVIQHIAPELRTPLVCKTALQYEHPNATRRMSADETKSGQEFEVNRLRAQFAAKPAQSEHVRESPI